MNTLNSYSRNSGKDTTASEKGSPEGVITAASITIPQIACLRYFLIVSFLRMPNAESNATIVGNSNTMPNVSTNEVNNEMYDERENWFGTAPLT